MADGLVTGLEALGPTFVKIGQILATRSDLVPPELADRLARLHDGAAPVEETLIRGQLAADLGGDPEAIFAAFDWEPLAAASIAQVHAARLRTGEEVVVKVRRPGIDEVMRADLRLLAAAARIVERRVPALRTHQPVRVVAQLSEALLEEIDFRTEARNQDDVRARDTGFLVPRVFDAYTTERTLVSARVRGRSAGAAFRAEQPDAARALAPVAARGLLQMILLDGVFHADPHPGNVLVTDDGRLALLDFGSVGRLSPRRREQVLIVLGSLVDADYAAVADVLMDWSGRSGPPPATLEPAVERFLSRYALGSGGQIQLAEAITAFIDIARENGLTLPPDLVLLMRALGIAEGLARGLDPDLDVVAAIAPVVLRAFTTRLGPAALGARALRVAKELDQILQIAPEALRRAFAHVRREGLAARVDAPDVADLARAVRRAGDTVGAAIASAGVFAAAGLVIASGRGPGWEAARITLLIVAFGAALLFWRRLRRRP